MFKTTIIQDEIKAKTVKKNTAKKRIHPFNFAEVKPLSKLPLSKLC